MATSIDYSGAIIRIIVPVADLTVLDAGPPVLYELDTDAFFDDVKLLEADHIGICFQNAIDHNPPYTVFGDTFARKIEIMNSTNTNPVLGGVPNTEEYEVFFTPDTAASVKLTGSNNNIADLQNGILANSIVQVIPTNSAGLIIGPGSGLSAAQDTKLTNIDTRTTYHDKIINNYKELIKIATSWYLVIYDDGEISGGTEILRKKMTDSTGADITDLAAGVLAAELESTA